MMARRGAIALLLGGVAALGGCGVLGGEKSYRFRMTVEVETPQGLKSGSGVYEVSARKLVALTSEEHEGSAGARGEATVVDLPGGPLFLLLNPERSGAQPLYASVTRALASDASLHPITDFVATVGKLGGWFGGAKADLPREDWPMMVRFGNIDDPKSVEQVDPAAIGVKRIRLETTSDDVTTGIEKRLGWLGDRGNIVSGPTTNPTLEETLYHEAFWQGM